MAKAIKAHYSLNRTNNDRLDTVKVYVEKYMEKLHI